MNNPFFGTINLFKQYQQMYDESANQLDFSSVNESARNHVNQSVRQASDNMVDPTEKFTFFNKIKNTADQASSKLGKGLSAIPGILSVGEATFGKAQFDDSVEAPGIVSDVYGQPVYNQESFIKSNEAFRDDIKGTVGRGVAQGAIGGLQAGAASGNPLVAAGAAIVGGIGGLFGGKKRKKSLLRESVRREDASLKGVSRFNDSSERFREDVEADDFRSALVNRRNNF